MESGLRAQQPSVLWAVVLASFILYSVPSFAPPDPEAQLKVSVCRRALKTIGLGALTALAGLTATTLVGEPVLNYLGLKPSQEQRIAEGVNAALDEREREDKELREILPASGEPGNATPEMIADAKLALQIARAQMDNPGTSPESVLAKTITDEQLPLLYAKLKSDLGKEPSDPVSQILANALTQKVEEVIANGDLATADKTKIREAITVIRMWWEGEVRKERLLGR